MSALFSNGGSEISRGGPMLCRWISPVLWPLALSPSQFFCWTALHATFDLWCPFLVLMDDSKEELCLALHEVNNNNDDMSM